uniref:LRRCT domain-containing protein n=1 Tax=Clastoptera arizonana TaxID=38151 RepID=A0A1B6DPN9_9HEMI
MGDERTPLALYLNTHSTGRLAFLCCMLLCLCRLTTCKTMCPSGCSCHDDTLRVTCIDANLEVVPIQFNPYIEYIDLCNNRIHSVDYTIQNYHKLKHLDLSRNKIHSLRPHNFELQERLTVLNISYNHITSLSKSTFKGLKSLQVLDISNNRIEVIHSGAFKETSDLMVLDLSYNKIMSFIDDHIFNNLRKIRIVSLQGNQILEVPSEIFNHIPSSSLEVVRLQENLIEELHERSFSSSVFSCLKTLNLASNVIRTIHRSTFSGLHSLVYLDLSDNNLTFIPTEQLSKLSQLTELDLSTNMVHEIKPVAFRSLFHLKVLRLSYMQYLSKIDSRAFVDNIRLETVIMDNNPNLKSIPTRIFHGNHHLLHVSVRGNSLSTLDSSHFPLDRLKSLDLSSNPLICNCSLLWLWDLVQQEFRKSFSTVNPVNETFLLPEESQRLRLHLRNLKCDEPETLTNVLLLDVPESNVRCETTWLTVAIVTGFVLTLFVITCILLLLINNDVSVLNCKKSKDTLESTVGESRHLASNIHGNNGPPPILMLMPGKDSTHADIADLSYLEPWVPVKTLDMERLSVGSNARKSPHIVYV